jgi:hypothetical protein
MAATAHLQTSPANIIPMTKALRFLILTLSLVTSFASAADPAFYFVAIGQHGNAVLFSDVKRLVTSELSYALLDRADKGCCFKAGTSSAASKPAPEADADRGELMSDDDKAIFRQAGRVVDPKKPESDLAYGIEGMQSVKRRGRDTYQITLQDDATVFVRTCYTAEGLRLRLFRRLNDKQPYAGYYYYLGYEVEPTCRQLAPGWPPIPARIHNFA